MTDMTEQTPDRQPASTPATAGQAALARAVVELEEHVAQRGWDAPVTVFALVRTATALAQDPGAALTVERVVLPPEAEQEAAKIHDAQERLAFLSSRSDREDVRIVVGVLRTGESWCAVRSRAQDSADRVVSGDALVPGLIEALGSTLV